MPKLIQIKKGDPLPPRSTFVGTGTKWENPYKWAMAPDLKHELFENVLPVARSLCTFPTAPSCEAEHRLLVIAREIDQLKGLDLAHDGDEKSAATLLKQANRDYANELAAYLVKIANPEAWA